MKLYPTWINKKLLKTDALTDVGDEVYDEVNEHLQKIVSTKPLVSIVIPAWNEELNLVRCIDSLSKSRFDHGIEIVFVDNNSDDKTFEVAKRFHISVYQEKTQGVGPARQTGQERAKGKYILMGDADCLYPPDWISLMIQELQTGNVACVYGTYSFLPESLFQKVFLFFYERLRDFTRRLKAKRRPFLSCLGLSMGYVKAQGLEVGFIKANIRGEDGRLAYELMKYGDILHIKSKKARVWTGNRTINRKGGFLNHLMGNLRKEVTNLDAYVKKLPEHDPKNTLSEKNSSAN